jgi:hypothetical protein
MKSVSLNLLKPSGSVQASNGTALPFDLLQFARCHKFHTYPLLSFQYHSRFAGRPTQSLFLTQSVPGDLRQGVKVPDRKADRLPASNDEA